MYVLLNLMFIRVTDDVMTVEILGSRNYICTYVTCGEIDVKTYANRCRALKTKETGRNEKKKQNKTSDRNIYYGNTK